MTHSHESMLGASVAGRAKRAELLLYMLVEGMHSEPSISTSNCTDCPYQSVECSAYLD